MNLGDSSPLFLEGKLMMYVRCSHDIYSTCFSLVSLVHKSCGTTKLGLWCMRIVRLWNLAKVYHCVYTLDV